MGISNNRDDRENLSLNTEEVNWEKVGSIVTFGLLLCYILAIPLKFQIGWILVRIQILLFLSIVIRIIGGIHTVSLTRTQIVVFIILGVTVCATFLGQIVAVPGQNLDRVPEVTRFIVFALACVLELNSRERLHKALIAVTAAATGVAILSVINIFVEFPFAHTSNSRTLGPHTFLTPRSLGIWMSFGSYGIFAVIGAVYAGLYTLRPEAFYKNVDAGSRRVISAIALGVILLGVYVGQSRSTILAFATVGICALLIFGYHPSSKLRSDNYTLYRTILIAGIVGTTVQAASILRSIIGVNVRSVTLRLDQYEFAFLLMSERPVLGWGWNYFGEAFGSGYTVHNLWLVLGVSLGIPVFLLWVYLFYKLGITLFRQALIKDGDAEIFAVLGIVVLVGATVELLLYPGFTPSAALVIGLLTAIVGIKRENKHMRPY